MLCCSILSLQKEEEEKSGAVRRRFKEKTIDVTRVTRRRLTLDIMFGQWSAVVYYYVVGVRILAYGSSRVVQCQQQYQQGTICIIQDPDQGGYESGSGSIEDQKILGSNSILRSREYWYSVFAEDKMRRGILNEEKQNEETHCAAFGFPNHLVVIRRSARDQDGWISRE